MDFGCIEPESLREIDPSMKKYLQVACLVPTGF